MKKNLRFTMIVLAILALLLSTFPASAGAIKTPLEGTWRFMGEPPDEEDLDAWGRAVGREIFPGFTTNIQCRNDTQYFQAITGNALFDGYASVETSCFYHFDIEGNLLGARIWGTATIFENPDYSEPKWNCSGQGLVGSDWSFDYAVVCQGAGENKGLQAKLKFGTPVGDDYPLTGYILEPGG